MKNIFKTGIIALALGTVTVACDNMNKNDNVDGVVDSTAVSSPTVDEAMSTSPDTATVVRTDSTAAQEAEQMGTETKDAAKDAVN